MVPKKAVLRTLPLLSQGDSQGLSRQQPRGSLRVPEQEANCTGQAIRKQNGGSLLWVPVGFFPMYNFSKITMYSCILKH